MAAPTDRRLNLLDVMILVAATAAGLAVCRWSLAGVTPDFGSVAIGTSPLAVFWSLALLPLRLRRPRPSWKRLRSRPGFVAGIATAIGLVLGASIMLPNFVNDRSGLEWTLNLCYLMAYANAAAWFALIWAGRWRPSPDWFDRLGRALSIYMIALSLVSYLWMNDLI